MQMSDLTDVFIWQKIPNVSVASTGIPDEVAKKNRYSNVLPGVLLPFDLKLHPLPIHTYLRRYTVE